MQRDPLVWCLFAAIGVRLALGFVMSQLIRSSPTEDEKWRWHQLMTYLDTVLLVGFSTFFLIRLHQPLILIIAIPLTLLLTVPKLRGIQWCMKCGRTFRSHNQFFPPLFCPECRARRESEY